MIAQNVKIAIEKSFSETSQKGCLELRKWVEEKNKALKSELKKISLQDQDFWFLDGSGIIKNRNHSFFTIEGIKGKVDKKIVEQPIIIQNEVGYLGFITKIIDGKLLFLMQAKIEPGNVNKVQLSPTIQATESNFKQKHGGKEPPYLSYFKNVNNYTVIYDGIQPEQCSRFYKKYNRNVVILVEDEVEILPRYKWASLNEIKELLISVPNLVNMDTRTVISCLPLDEIVPSLTTAEDESESLESKIDKYREANSSERNFCSLSELKGWKIDSNGITCTKPYPFSVNYYSISIEDREVTKWTQPLVVANGEALFGTFICFVDNELNFLIRIKEEIGANNCALFGPYIQKESIELNRICDSKNEILFFKLLNEKKNIAVDIVQSEEGGRFYHEQNRNVLILVDKKDLDLKEKHCFLVNYKTLRMLINDYKDVNIQMRSLLSMIGETLWKIKK